jgi:hypothetical protein
VQNRQIIVQETLKKVPDRHFVGCVSVMKNYQLSTTEPSCDQFPLVSDSAAHISDSLASSAAVHLHLVQILQRRRAESDAISI